MPFPLRAACGFALAIPFALSAQDADLILRDARICTARHVPRGAPHVTVHNPPSAAA